MSLFDVRYAACECVQAYFYDHTEIRMHFLHRAIEGHMSGADETVNIITIMVNGPGSQQSNEPYRIWFASLLVLHLIYDNTDAKKLLMGISEGDAESGEEVVTCIQILTGNLIAALQASEDERICIAYLMLLCVWLFDEVDAVNDLLLEGSTVHSLIQVLKRPQKGREVVQGLCCLLLGIVYEFSRKESPMPRRSLAPLLSTGVGREQYVQHISRLRQDRQLRDFEVLPQNLSSSINGTLPEVFFDQTFVDFAKDNFSRIIRAIDRDPGREVLKQHEGVDRDLVDSLRSQIQDTTEALGRAEADKAAAEHRLSQEQADHRKTADASKNELGRIKSINGALQRGHEAELERLESAHHIAISNTTERQKRDLEESQRRIQELRAENARHLETATAQHKHEVDQLHIRVQRTQTEAAHAAERSTEQYRQTLEQTRSVAMKETTQAAEQHQQALAESEAQLAKVRAAAVKQTESAATRHEEALANWERHAKDLETKLKTANDRIEALQHDHELDADSLRDREAQIQSLTQASKHMEEIIERHVANIHKLEAQLISSEGRVKTASEKERAAQGKLQEKEEARQAAQTELDDLLILLGDLEEKRVGDKVRFDFLFSLGSRTKRPCNLC